ncbi:MAG: hypothetical protein HYU24_15220 [Candidatus Rokubacteria bacterium]|nr:hypothetical protein [Candidatus Rokubacteria bacterium]
MTDGRAMLSEFAFANSLAVLAACFYVVFFALGLVAPEMSGFLFNAQFLGADVASLLPKRVSPSNFLGTVVTLVLTGWVGGYVWAWLYNKLTKYF